MSGAPRCGEQYFFLRSMSGAPRCGEQYFFLRRMSGAPRCGEPHTESDLVQVKIVRYLQSDSV